MLELENETLKELQMDVQGIRRAIYGYNSSPGLIGKVDKLETMASDLRRVLLTVGGGVVIAVILQTIALLGKGV